MRSSLLAVAAVLVVSGGSGALAQTDSVSVAAAAIPQVSTNGTGELRLPPDRVRMVFSVETSGPDAATVGRDNAQRTAGLREALAKQGIPIARLQTIGYSLRNQPRARSRDAKPENWFVGRNAIRIEYDDLSRVGAIVDAALSGGANQVEELSFGLANEADARRQALAAAVRNARLQAETMAQAAGGRLGPLIELSSGGPGVRPVGFEARSLAASAETPVSRTEVSVTEQVSGRWRFVMP
jgi:uncharacterized protein